ncbi:MAG: hypothetical protein CSYNP_03800 [Syntrophus sp. SKADARSKE-3]|nr:hypothetical protein [Syntrophus sp. SKADARSKE-3]
MYAVPRWRGCRGWLPQLLRALHPDTPYQVRDKLLNRMHKIEDFNNLLNLLEIYHTIFKITMLLLLFIQLYFFRLRNEMARLFSHFTFIQDIPYYFEQQTLSYGFCDEVTDTQCSLFS